MGVSISSPRCSISAFAKAADVFLDWVGTAFVRKPPYWYTVFERLPIEQQGRMSIIWDIIAADG
jgi:hypothetical protein